jgi:hypothetical protein
MTIRVTQAGISNVPFLLDIFFAGISYGFVTKDFDFVELIYL